ncbi:MAG: beta-lactamase family protein [Fimbriimonadaceae bacterium]|nr:beta-lactamase family protein [Fimbriimonadaceae bacterium]
MLTLALLLSMRDGGAPVSGFDPKAAQAILDRAVAGRLVPSASFVASEKGRTMAFVASGLADREAKVPVTRDTVFQIMSMTKPVTAAAVMILVDEGKVSLGATVDRYLPEFARPSVKSGDGVKPSPRAPTIAELLTHTSGMDPDNPPGVSDEDKRRMTLGAYTALIARMPLNTEPGARVRYSGTGYTVLGRLVEVVAKEPFERFVNRRLFEPLGMKRTWFFLPTAQRPRLARMYVEPEAGWKELGEDPFRNGAKLPNPAGGLYSTAEDMARFMSLFANGGKAGRRVVLKPESVRRMTTPQLRPGLPGSESGSDWALGMVVYKGDRPLAGSFGHTGAFGTAMWADPKSSRVGVFMTQCFGPTVAIREDLARLLRP